MSTASVNPNNSLYQVDKLTKKNFTMWKYRIEMVLKSRKLWKYVEAEAEEKKEKELEQEALSQIGLTISDGVVGHIRGIKTPRAAWLKLCAVFEQKGLASQVYLRRKLFTLKFAESGSMQDHLNNISELANQLDAIGDPVKDRDLAIISLITLPESYKPLVTTLEASPANDITFDFVSARLLAEEEQQQEFKPPGPIETAFIGTTFGKYQGRRPPMQCEYCGLTGHTEARCWDKHGRPEGVSNTIKGRVQNGVRPTTNTIIDTTF
jgi:hypothetical protein